jgi:hypothetical protein
VGILLALFLGTFGIHHFYLRRTGLGILYCCFFWTGIPTMLGFIECFFMPGRVREFNAIQAAGIAAALGISMPGFGQPVSVNVNVAPGAGQSAPATPPYPPPPYTPVNVTDHLATVVTCAKCQKTNVAGAKFCSGCGNAL